MSPVSGTGTFISQSMKHTGLSKWQVGRKKAPDHIFLLKSLFDRNVLWSLYFTYPAYVHIDNNKYENRVTFIPAGRGTKKAWYL